MADMDFSCSGEQLASARTQRILDKIHDANTAPKKSKHITYKLLQIHVIIIDLK